MNVPWYKKYSEFHDKVEEKKIEFENQCNQIGVNKNRVLSEFSTDIISRIVHESNWQEGIYLNLNATREIAVVAFETINRKMPHINLEALLRSHYKQVNNLKNDGISNEQLAAYNLAKAHISLLYIQKEMLFRVSSLLSIALLNLQEYFIKNESSIPEDARETIESGFNIIQNLKEDNDPVGAPYIGGETNSEVFVTFLGQNFDEILNEPYLNIGHVHFLHQITLARIIPTGKLGTFRTVPVSVGDPDVYFAPPSAIPGMMEKYCKQFPFLILNKDRDPILAAAEASYNFVRIHPYVDGNGRVSRLLMNFVLNGKYPPVYIKASKEGRHRYGQALKRANRGSMEPLACLISMSIIEIYDKMIASLSVMNKDR